ncbi:MAG: hypothetical protein ACRDWB_10130 [Acidimicrobiales bacterium]
MDQTAIATPRLSPAPSSGPDIAMRHLLRIPDEQPAIRESATHRIFSASIFLSALRCLLSYIVLPIVLPAVGLASSVGPAIGIPVGLVALVFDYLGVRRFWLANHHQRWMFSAIYAAVGGMVLALVIIDVVHVFN